MEIARLLLGILVAVALPASVPNLRRRPILALLFSITFASYAILPVLNGVAACISFFSTILASHGNNFVRCSLAGDGFSQSLRDAFKGMGRAVTLLVVLGLMVVPVVVGWISFFGHRYATAVTLSVGNDKVAIAVSGLMLAVFVGNDLAYIAIRRYLPLLTVTSPGAISIVPSGLYVGWVERAVIFSFVAGGQADAAALAVAAKALFRLPEVQDEEKGSVLGEYIIVGTLASVLASIMCAILVRLALGLSVL